MSATLAGTSVGASVPEALGRAIAELQPVAVIRLGATADWVAVAVDSVSAGSTGPYAAHHIDPRTNRVVARVELPGEPCAGLAVGFGSLWLPLCGKPAQLAKLDMSRNVLNAVFQIGPAGAAAGITASGDSLWLVTNREGTLARIDPDSGRARQNIRMPAGCNPRGQLATMPSG